MNSEQNRSEQLKEANGKSPEAVPAEAAAAAEAPAEAPAEAEATSSETEAPAETEAPVEAETAPVEAPVETEAVPAETPAEAEAPVEAEAVPTETPTGAEAAPAEAPEKQLTEEEMRAVLHAKKRSRTIKLVAMLGIAGLLIAGTVLWIYFKSVSGWHDSSEGRYYLTQTGRVTGLNKIDGKIYIFDNNGYIIEGPAEIDGSIYYSTANGIVKGTVLIDGVEYYFSEEDGTLNRGFFRKEGVTYYRNAYGFVEDGIREINGSIYLIAKDGRLLSGWTDIGEGMRYFASSDNTMMVGFREIDGEQYFFDWNGYVGKGFLRTDNTCFYAEEQNGALKFGRMTIGEKEYYLTEDGQILNGVGMVDDTAWYFKDNAFVYGWIEDESGRFYCGEDGMYQGAQVIDGRAYYFEEDYRLARGWIMRGENRYFFDDEGAMVTGWQEIEEKTYCFAETGELYIGEKTIDGTKYMFAEDGAYYDGFVLSEEGNQYFDKGYLQTGVTKIEDKYYFLNDKGIPTGGMQKVNGLLAAYDANGIATPGWKTIEEKKYYFGPDGIMLHGSVSINGKRYYLSKDGGFLTPGWHTDGGKMYVYNDGTIATGVVRVDGALHAFSDAGILITKEGLQKVGGKLRYVYSSGKIAVSTTITVSGVTYEVDANGVASQKFKPITTNNIDEYLTYVLNNELANKEIRTIYNWVRKKVGYYSYYGSGSVGLKTLSVEALNKGCGACWHYAGLLAYTLQKAGYNAIVIKGGGHTYGEHQWVAVQSGGQWLYIDAMRDNVYMLTQAQLDAQKFNYSVGHGPTPEVGGTHCYYYGYKDPYGNYHDGK